MVPVCSKIIRNCLSRRRLQVRLRRVQFSSVSSSRTRTPCSQAATWPRPRQSISQAIRYQYNVSFCTLQRLDHRNDFPACSGCPFITESSEGRVLVTKPITTYLVLSWVTTRGQTTPPTLSTILTASSPSIYRLPSRALGSARWHGDILSPHNLAWARTRP